MTGRFFGSLAGLATLLIVALSTGAQLYYMLFFALLLTVLCSLLAALLALLTLRISAGSKPRRVVRNDFVPLKIRARHMALLPVGRIRLFLSSPDPARGVLTADVPFLPIAEHAVTLSFPCPHRGIYGVGVEKAEVQDMLGLFRFSARKSGMRFTVEVAPRSMRLLPLVLTAPDGYDAMNARSSEDTDSPADVRTWQSGDAMKKIHWKLSMRKRELMVRTYEETVRPDTLVLPDLKRLNLPESHRLALEDAICETALSVAKAQLVEGYPVRMPLMSESPTEIAGQTAGDLARFEEALTHVSFDSPYPYMKVLTLEMRRNQRTGGVVLITARLDARIADLARQFHKSGVSAAVYSVGESEADDLLAHLLRDGILAKRIDPYALPEETDNG
ncbi:MAG: DUF58 domain-containing protein [Christensenellales bacterium]|jgi:uncharacterized protein (DUF58 family)